jgi:hypothetical protein
MIDTRLRPALPYLLGLLIAGILLFYADQIPYSEREGQLGPDFWPKLALSLMAVVSLFEIIKIALGGRSEAQGIADVLESGGEGEESAATYPLLLAGGCALVLAYGVLVTVLGFILTTFLFLVAFMYLGRYRAHGVIWMAALASTLLIALIFIKVVYVSLPRGIPPFDHVTDLVTGLF